MASSGRSVLASVVGWVVVALIVWLLFALLLGALGFILRVIVALAVIAALVVVYRKLRSG